MFVKNNQGNKMVAGHIVSRQNEWNKPKTMKQKLNSKWPASQNWQTSVEDVNWISILTPLEFWKITYKFWH